VPTTPVCGGLAMLRVAHSLRDPLLGEKAEFLATTPLIVTWEDQRRLRGRRARNGKVAVAAPGGRGGEAGVLEAVEGREEVGEEEEEGVYRSPAPWRLSNWR
jgi:hypothetical protein